MEKLSFQLRETWELRAFAILIGILLSVSGPALARPAVHMQNTVSAPKKSITVTGKVTDKNNQPLVGVTVLAPDDGNTATLTDTRGQYTITVSNDGTLLQFSFVGYATQSVTIHAQTRVDVTLEEQATAIDNVVVVGFSTQRKATVTGSVSAVSTKDLLQSPQANISNALAGRMPGLLSVQRSGEPGKDASTLRIRGIGTFAGNQDPLIMVDGIESSNYNNIDPNEIESITILKDASATAVYGVRGANGVLLITTKRGELGKPSISLSTSVAMSNFPFLRENMNSYEYASSYNRALAFDSYVTNNYTQKYTGEQIEKYRTHSDPIFYPSIDWYDYMLRKHSFQSQSNLNIRGGTERVKYFFSLGYFTQNGMLDTDVLSQDYDYQIKYSRYNFRSNFDIKILKGLTASIDLSTQMDDTRGPNWDTPLFMEMLSSVPSNVSPGVIDGKIVTIQTITQSTWTPLAAYDKGWHKDYGNTLNGSVRLTYDMGYLLKGLSLRGAFSYKDYNLEIKKYEASGISYEARRLDDGSIVYIPSGDPKPFGASSSVQKNRRIYIEAGLEYRNSFGGNNVTALVLYNQSKYHDPTLAFLVPNGYQGLVGRVTYDFRNRYLAEFNIGYNGTENFAKGNRFGVFPSVSVGWVPTEESFFPKNNVLTFLKIRGSYGVVGNDRIGGDRFLYRPTAYSYYDNAYYFGEVGSDYQGHKGADEGKLGNPLLTWEKAKKFNVGADIHLWKDKISLTCDYFVENRNNILWNRGTVPDIIGANMPAYNLGRMKNSGFEGEINYRDTFGKFNLFVKANYTYAHNVIKYQDEVFWQNAYQYRTGQRYGQFFGYVAEGLFNTWEQVNDANRPVYQWNNNRIQPGDIRYKDVNGDGRIDNNDQVPIGYSNFPEIMFGLSIGGEYKGFDFSFLLQGATRVSTMPSRRTMRGFYTGTGANKDLLKSWSPERYEQGLEVVYPRFSVTNDEHNYVTSTYWLEDATYLRLKSAEVGYTFRGKVLRRLGISGLRVYANGNNLLTWCDLFPGEDPEFPLCEANSEPYPLTRTFNLGVNINF